MLQKVEQRGKEAVYGAQKLDRNNSKLAQALEKHAELEEQVRASRGVVKVTLHRLVCIYSTGSSERHVDSA